MHSSPPKKKSYDGRDTREARPNRAGWNRLRAAALSGVALAATGLVGSGPAEARLTRLEIQSREPYAGGHGFGDAGSFERIVATARFEVDPADPRNRVIVNLDKAPRNAAGKVEFSAPVFLIKPVDMARGNGKLFYDINNRGNTDLGAVADPAKVNGQVAQQLRMGFTLVDAGWHGDGKPNARQLFPQFPVATQADGSPIIGKKRLEFSVSSRGYSQPLAQFWKAYEPADSATSASTLVVRRRAGGAATPVPADAWGFGTCPTGRDSFKPGTGDIGLFNGFSPDRLYELTYPAKNPIVMGLAYAVTRDLAAYLRSGAKDDAGVANPLAVAGGAPTIRRTYAYGASSTGMYLREYLYLGFNETEDGHKLFDGVFINTGGASRLFANVEFAHPTFCSAQDGHKDFVSNAIGPASFGVSRDPLTGRTDGILKRPRTDPLLMEAVDENSFWTWKNSLQVVDGRGKAIAIPDNVRLYFKGGSGHLGIYGLMSPPVTPHGFMGECANPAQALNAPGFNPQAVERSLPGIGGALVAILDDWVEGKAPPPPSNFPTLDNGGLVTLAQYRALFPKVKDFAPPEVMAQLDVLDFGPGFGPTGGRMTALPPRHGKAYQLYVPRPDRDGLATGTHRPIEISVPLGTNVGWNIRREGNRAGDLCGLEGSFIPFARTKAERLAAGDPRLSLEERFGNHAGFVAQVRKEAAALVQSRFMLQADANAWVDIAEKSDVLRP
ncbi:hypothetical protein LWE61_10990 [Sphingobium sufflavum]|uniref:alpha/beta hydrolase domain-containing protein n=1 Tax=Sphingobium sufflavum TaxID=1129547 RepID=UPI001F2F79DB|nr:alpha/beta hydrolase domain-containing protein [Sphingobium sufflavum]MCE7797083.1 hypothetical protein [Sphingobium sufflavum]